MIRIFFTAFIIVSGFILLTGCTASNKQKSAPTGITEKWIDQKLAHATEQYKTLIKNVPRGVMPESFGNNGLKTCNSESWVAGFYPGTLLFLYETSKDTALYNEATRRIKLMNKEQYNTGTHDLGFMMYCSYGNLNRIEPERKYQQILLNSAKSLASRFNPNVGCIRSWGNSKDTTEFRVIIDNMMNLELLFWATRVSHDSSFYKIAVTHAQTTLKNHFRPDHSSYHVVVYDPRNGEVIKKQTAQGFSDASAWSRGQSWGLYGYTLMYRETKDKKYLEQAQNIAQFILDNPHLPADKIPYWDYDAPDIPNAKRDASAGAIAASALIELSKYSNKTLSKKYLQAVEIMLQTLSTSQYLAKTGTNGGFLLMHSVANMNGPTDVDAPLPYADYYYVEALERYKNLLK
jgi:unsaturated chondroitin disaccharide hydrolase